MATSALGNFAGESNSWTTRNSAWYDSGIFRCVIERDYRLSHVRSAPGWDWSGTLVNRLRVNDSGDGDIAADQRGMPKQEDEQELRVGHNGRSRVLPPRLLTGICPSNPFCY